MTIRSSNTISTVSTPPGSPEDAARLPTAGSVQGVRRRGEVAPDATGASVVRPDFWALGLSRVVGMQVTITDAALDLARRKGGMIALDFVRPVG
jgi:hypothetical protein